MINTSTIMEHFVDWLKDDINLQSVKVITRGEPVNESSSQAKGGWICLYRRAVIGEPRNLGVPPNNYEGDLIFDIVVQSTNIKSGAASEDELEELVKAVLDRIVQVPRTYVDTFIEYAVEYTYIEEEKKSIYFQAAIITMTARFSIEVE